MFKHILVPLDGSDLAEGVLPHVRRMAGAFGARVTLLHVSEAPADGGVDVMDWHLRKMEAEAYLDGQASALEQAGLAVDRDLLDGPVAERIVAYAERHQIDLTILCTHGRGGLSEWNVSHIAQKVLQRGTMSILLVHADGASDDVAEEVGYRRIMIPLDGSQRAEYVLPIAGVLARQEEAELLLAHVTMRPFVFQRLPPTAAEKASMEWLVDHNQDQARSYFEELAQRMPESTKTALPVSENVALALHQLVRDEAVELVVLSAHGHSAHGQWAYGNVVSNFITHGSVTLLIVQDLPQPLYQQPQAVTLRREPLHRGPERTFMLRAS